MTRARHSLGLVGLSPIECAKIATFVESEAEGAGCPWLVLHSDSCDALIVPSDVDFTPDPYQVLIRLNRFGGQHCDGLSISSPISARELIDVLGEAQSTLGKGESRPAGALQVKMEDWHTAPSPQPAPANDFSAHGGYGSQPMHLATDGSAALQAQPSAMTHAPQPAVQPQQAIYPVAAPDVQGQTQGNNANDGDHEFSAAWDQIAVALYSIVQNSAPAVAEIRIENLDMIRIDFRFRAYNSRVSLDHISANGSRIAIRSTLVEAFRPPIVNLPGESLDKLFWFIGSQAFQGRGAPWLKPEDRYRLRRWPNFTELNHAVADMRAAAAIGNCFLNAAELAAAAGIPVVSATRTLNAYSLMGLLEIQTEPSAAAPVFAQTNVRPAETTENGGLFSKLRKKLGL